MAIDDPNVTPEELPPINEPAEWVEHLPAMVPGVLVKSSPQGRGPSNFQALVLDARTRYLKDQLTQILVQGINVIGTLNNEAELDAIPTDDLKRGDAYFVEGSLRVWNKIEWINSGSLLGPRGITLLGTWPDNQSLPAVDAGTIGDAYVWKSDIWLLVPGQGQNPQGWRSTGRQEHRTGKLIIISGRRDRVVWPFENARQLTGIFFASSVLAGKCRWLARAISATLSGFIFPVVPA